MADLNKFINEFKHGFQQTNRFFVQFFIPPSLVASMIANAGLFGIVDAGMMIPNVVKWLYTGMLCSDARMPDRGFGMVDLSMYGYTEHFPMHTEYSEFACTFMMPHTTNIENDAAVPRFFDYWMNQIQNAQGGAESGMDFKFPNDYYATAILTLLDRKDHGTASYQFTNIYPKAVDSVPLSWGSENEYAKLPVSFNFSYWKMLPHIGSVGIATATNLVNKLI